MHYLHQSYPREEMAALYLAADVMLVTPLRDGMNLVAKEYVACRNDEDGALVLSEFTGAADELAGAFLVNPHDIEGLKDAIVRAATSHPAEARRRMRAMRRRVREHDVARWAASFLDSLSGAPGADRRPGARGQLSRPGMTAPGSSAGDDPGAELCSGGPAEHPVEGAPGGFGPAGASARGGPGRAVLGWSWAWSWASAAGAAGLASRWAWSSRMCRSRSDRAGYLSPQSGHVRLDM